MNPYKMKTIKLLLLLCSLTLLSGKSFANFTSIKLKVTGVTCSMCSNSVHKALSSLPFIDKIEVDLQKSEYQLTFKPDQKVVIDDIKNKVEGAGFSVGELTATFKFENLAIQKDFHYQFQGNTYHFVDVKNQTLNEVVTVKFIDKGLTSKKEYKKYSGLTTYECIKTGRSQHCCNVGNNQRIYHITL